VASIEEPAVQFAPVVDNSQAIAETVEEIRFYLSSGLADQASASLTKARTAECDEATLATLRQEIETAAAVAAAPEIEVVDQFVAEEPPVEEVAPLPPPKVVAPPKVAAPPAPVPVAPPKVAAAPVQAPPAAAKVAVAPPKPPRLLPNRQLRPRLGYVG